MVVFRSGILTGLKGWVPFGGHIRPSSIVGLSLLWKKAQKKEKKNNTSDVMKRIIPHRMLSWVLFVWSPWKVASRVTSRHHWVMNRIIDKNPKIRRSGL